MMFLCLKVRPLLSPMRGVHSTHHHFLSKSCVAIKFSWPVKGPQIENRMIQHDLDHHVIIYIKQTPSLICLPIIPLAPKSCSDIVNVLDYQSNDGPWAVQTSCKLVHTLLLQRHHSKVVGGIMSSKGSIRSARSK